MGLHNKSYNTSNFVFLNIVFKNGVILIILNHSLNIPICYDINL